MNYCDILLWYGVPCPQPFTVWTGMHCMHRYCHTNYTSTYSIALTQVFNPSFNLHQTFGCKFPRHPALVLEYRPVIVRSGSYNFVGPHGPSSHQSNTDMINWCRGDFKCAAVSSLSFRLFEFRVSITCEGKAQWHTCCLNASLHMVYSSEIEHQKASLFCQWRSIILFFMIKATWPFPII